MKKNGKMGKTSLNKAKEKKEKTSKPKSHALLWKAEQIP